MNQEKQPESLRLDQAMKQADRAEEMAIKYGRGTSLGMEAYAAAQAIRALHSRIADLEAQLSAIGAGGVESLSKIGPARGQAGFEAWWRDKYPSFAMHAPDVWEAAMHHAAQPARECLQQSALDQIADIFQIGSEARKNFATIIECARNASRRSACLSAVESTFFMVETPPDYDEGDIEPGQECLLNWGQDAGAYTVQFGKALAALQAAPPAHAQDVPARNMEDEQCRSEPSDWSPPSGYDGDGSVAAMARAAPPAPQGEKVYAALPKPGPIGYASVADVQSYAKTMSIGTHLPGVRDVSLWTSDQLRAFADATAALRATAAPAQEHATQLAGQEHLLDATRDLQEMWDELAKVSRGEHVAGPSPSAMRRYGRALTAAERAMVAAAPIQAQEDARDSAQAIDAAAKAIANGMDYPWEHMTKEGHANMHEVAATALAAARAAQGGA